MNPKPETGPVGVVVLAAGASVRMGAPKQLLPYRGTGLLRYSVETALGASEGPVVVVLGCSAEDFRPALDGLPVQIVENAEWKAGMGGSLRVGLEALLEEHPETGAVLILVCDQPLLSELVLKELIAAYRKGGHGIVASEYGGTLGVPALFDRVFFPDLLALHGREGAKGLIGQNREVVAAVPFPDGIIDLDTPADCERLQISLPTPNLPISS